MYYQESNYQCRDGPVSELAMRLVKLGAWFAGSRKGEQPRRLFVFMPCESPAAALIALGAVARRLERAPPASSHWERLVNGAQVGARVQRRPTENAPFGRSTFTLTKMGDELLRARRPGSSAAYQITPREARFWRVDGLAENPNVSRAQIEQLRQVACALVVRMHDGSISTRDDRMTLVCSRAGEEPFRRTLEAVRLSTQGAENEAPLSSLLLPEDRSDFWRMHLTSVRAGATLIDPGTEIIVSDTHDAYLDLSTAARQADICAVVEMDADHGKHKEFNQALQNMRRYYRFSLLPFDAPQVALAWQPLLLTKHNDQEHAA